MIIGKIFAPSFSSVRNYNSRPITKNNQTNEVAFGMINLEKAQKFNYEEILNLAKKTDGVELSKDILPELEQLFDKGKRVLFYEEIPNQDFRHQFVLCLKEPNPLYGISRTFVKYENVPELGSGYGEVSGAGSSISIAIKNLIKKASIGTISN